MWGEAGGAKFTGELIFGPERVYGRFTEARTLDGKQFPVCAQLVDRYDDQLGVKIEGRPGPDTATIISTQQLEAVRVGARRE